MRKLIFIASLIAFLFVIVFVAAGVRSEWDRHANEAEILSHSFLAELVVFGNQTCPVTGDRVKDEFSVTYQNKKIGLCCPHCKEYFLKNPGKYL